MPRAQLTDDELETMRQRLVDAALALYRAEGLEALSFRRLAEAVGLSHTLPYRYFENKEALLARLRTECLARFHATVLRHERRAVTPLARMQAVVEAYVAFVRAHPAEYLLIFSMDQPPPTRYPALLAARRALFDHATSVMQACIDEGLVTGDALELSHSAWIMLHGLMTLHVANQLVHGLTVEDLVQPVIARLMAGPAPGARAIAPAPRANAERRGRRAAARRPA